MQKMFCWILFTPFLIGNALGCESQKQDVALQIKANEHKTETAVCLDDEILDRQRGLCWKKHSLGIHEENKYTTAISKCRNWGGRLPTVKEFKSLLGNCRDVGDALDSVECNKCDKSNMCRLLMVSGPLGSSWSFWAEGNKPKRVNPDLGYVTPRFASDDPNEEMVLTACVRDLKTDADQNNKTPISENSIAEKEVNSTKKIISDASTVSSGADFKEVRLSNDSMLRKIEKMESEKEYDAVAKHEKELLSKGLIQKGKLGIKWIYSQPAGVFFSSTEVTVRQFKSCIERGGCQKPTWFGNVDRCNWHFESLLDFPVNCLDMNASNEVCIWLGGRLPTRDEWVAEASNNGQWKWPWGNEPDINCELAVWNGRGWDDRFKDECFNWNIPTPPCSKRAGNSVSGLCDMSGSLWERVAEHLTKNEHGKILGLGEYACGGSWYNNDIYALCATTCARYNQHDEYVGVRCVKR